MGRSLQVIPKQIDFVKSKVKLKGFPSQNALAMELGLSRATVSNFLNGKPVDYLNFVEISEKLGLSWLEISLQDEPIRKDGVLVKKKVFALNREINVNFKDLFKALTKALVDLKTGNISKLPGDIIDALYSVSLDLNSPTIAWLLIFRSLNRAICSLVEDNKELFGYEYKNFDAIEELIEFSLEESEITIDRNFFNRPKDLTILKEIETPFKQWLQLYGLNEAQATSIYNRLPSYFVFALNDEWRDRQPEYHELHKYLITPFTEVGNQEQSWLHYSTWLQKQVDEPMFSEAFSLRQVYVEPRAYYEHEIKANKHQNCELRNRGEKQYQKVVVDLETHLENWLEQENKEDAIRIISGDPGAGKSSFSKMFASRQVDKGKTPVLFIPLHHFDPTGDLVEAISRFTRDDEYLSYNLLDGELKESRLLIIFDGLDELSMQGKLGAEVARNFIDEVQKTISRINYRQTRWQVIISGRPIVISSNQSLIRKSEQILHILPYFVTENKRDNYQDENGLLKQDRRNLWWQRYGVATGNNYDRIPDELNLDNLLEITIQPLLNYLVALSYTRSKDDNIDAKDKIVFSEDTNLNAIYEDLLKSVYDRGWDTKQHPTLQGISYKNFVRILEEIALAAWHGNGRTTTVREIETHCESSGLRNLLKIFTEGVKAGVTNLLTAFYFRQSGISNEGDRTFEFTHKSFGEYLTAKRIVRALAKINNELKKREEDPDEGWDERQALTQWIMLCGISAIDRYLFNFICNEIALQNKKDVEEWQKTIAYLIGYMLRQGMPMEKLDPRPSYKEECRQGRNAEEALLVVVNACARFVETISEIEWESDFSFINWLSVLMQYSGDDIRIAYTCLSWLNLEEAYLFGASFESMNFRQTNLKKATLVRASLQDADLENADLRDANLYEADFRTAYLKGAKLEGAKLEGAKIDKNYIAN